jgi:hypothetical protein
MTATGHGTPYYGWKRLRVDGGPSFIVPESAVVGGKPNFAGACADARLRRFRLFSCSATVGEFVWYARRMDITAAALG